MVDVVVDVVDGVAVGVGGVVVVEIVVGVWFGVVVAVAVVVVVEIVVGAWLGVAVGVAVAIGVYVMNAIYLRHWQTYLIAVAFYWEQGFYAPNKRAAFKMARATWPWAKVLQCKGVVEPTCGTTSGPSTL